MRHLSNRQIFGTAFWLFATPMCLAARFTERDQVMHPARGTDPNEWMRTDWCGFCETDTDQFFRVFKDEPVVTKECLSCGAVSEYWDTK